MTFWYDREENIRGGRVVGVIILISMFITGTIMLGFSFKTVDYNEYGLKQNQITKQIDSNIYEEGFHFIGFWNDFIRFPSTYITVEFTPSDLADDIPISVQTKNGLLVQVDISFQFRIRKSDLLEVYSSFGKAYQSYIQAQARSALRAVIGEYDAETLYANRSAIIASLSTALYDTLSTIVKVGEFQLRHIDFPDSFEEAVERYEVWRVEVEIAQKEQEAELVRQQTQLLVAEYQANQTIISYEGIANALESLRLSLNFTQDQLLTYLWIETIQEHDQSYLFIGLDNFPFLLPLNETA